MSCRIIYTVFSTPPVSLLNLFDYKNKKRRHKTAFIINQNKYLLRIETAFFAF
ncbi:MAG: hypothetical protein IJ780_04425 [Neisseriaceae bacterium]|nr:hypothetical protein [Neisseriaceae bacterium]